MITADETILNDYINSRYTKKDYIKRADAHNNNENTTSDYVLITTGRIVDLFQNFSSGPVSLYFFKDEDGVLQMQPAAMKVVKLTGNVEEDILKLNINSETDIFYELQKISNGELRLRYYKGNVPVYNHEREIYKKSFPYNV